MAVEPVARELAVAAEQVGEVAQVRERGVGEAALRGAAHRHRPARVEDVDQQVGADRRADHDRDGERRARDRRVAAQPRRAEQHGDPRRHDQRGVQAREHEQGRGRRRRSDGAPGAEATAHGGEQQGREGRHDHRRLHPVRERPQGPVEGQLAPEALALRARPEPQPERDQRDGVEPEREQREPRRHGAVGGLQRAAEQHDRDHQQREAPQHGGPEQRGVAEPDRLQDPRHGGEQRLPERMEAVGGPRPVERRHAGLGPGPGDLQVVEGVGGDVAEQPAGAVQREVREDRHGQQAGGAREHDAGPRSPSSLHHAESRYGRRGPRARPARRRRRAAARTRRRRPSRWRRRRPRA